MPPKKMGVNSKAEAARARRSATEAERKETDARQKEEQYWREAEGSKSRAAKKREEEAEKRAEAATRKAEARRLAELEEKELEKMAKKPDKKVSRVAIPVPKVTEAELRKRREEEGAAMEKKSEESKKKQTRTAAEEEYERMVLVSNTNRDDSVIEARTVEDAIAQMAVAEPLLVDRHPERRLKASFKAFEEAELPRLKEEKPGLTHNQYKDMIWKLWKKSPDNPLNQVAAE
ncbi:uncharacterized protein LOC126782709 [Argentina anserina]|uniref:uncharacterized protein LOC126782709 n=1 Tax=Argentina anserina TaxID=57926 RepID=UPI0021766BAA|nr:uncharacterized protein LOC126782709 [Potentilla anserina]